MLGIGQLVCLLALCLLTKCEDIIASESTYNEKLDLTPLPRNTVLVSFGFNLFSDPISFDGHHLDNREFKAHYGIFPRSVGQIVRSTGTYQLHLRFTQGWWDSEEWGSLPHQGKYAGGTGVEVWASIYGRDQSEAESQWYELVSALSGLFCASLNFMDSTRTTPNPTSFLSDAVHSTAFAFANNSESPGLHQFHGSLPQETICTENLAPFLKLLPCKGRAGISSLLDGHKIFDSKWQSMALDFNPVCTDVLRLAERKLNPVPEPPPPEELHCNLSKSYSSDSICFPLPTPDEINWKLSDIFGRQIQSHCVPNRLTTPDDVDMKPSVCTHATSQWDISGEGGSLLYSEGDNKCFSLSQNGDFDLIFSTSNSSSISAIERPPVYIQRSMTGRGQQHGGIQVIITNPSTSEEVSLIYFETLPWYMKPYLHTMTKVLSVDDSSSVDVANLYREKAFRDVKYKPFLERVRGTSLELGFSIPPTGQLTLSYDFDNILLYLNEYPPDANRGFDVPPGILTVLAKSTNGSLSPYYALRTSSLLLSLPTPDFSMPYNVIILTSTVMALAFGAFFNILVRRFVYEEEVQRNRVSPLAKLKQWLAQKTGRRLQHELASPDQTDVK